VACHTGRGTYIYCISKHRNTHAHTNVRSTCMLSLGFGPEACSTVKPYLAALARSTHLDFFGRQDTGELVCSFGFFSTYQRGKQGLAMPTTIFPPMEPMREFAPLSDEPSHICRWQVTSAGVAIVIASPSTQKHMHTHILGQHAFPHWVPDPQRPLR
jgi:hypothetical protein